MMAVRRSATSAVKIASRLTSLDLNVAISSAEIACLTILLLTSKMVGFNRFPACKVEGVRSSSTNKLFSSSVLKKSTKSTSSLKWISTWTRTGIWNGVLSLSATTMSKGLAGSIKLPDASVAKTCAWTVELQLILALAALMWEAKNLNYGLATRMSSIVQGVLSGLKRYLGARTWLATNVVTSGVGNVEQITTQIYSVVKQLMDCLERLYVNVAPNGQTNAANCSGSPCYSSSVLHLLSFWDPCSVL